MRRKLFTLSTLVLSAFLTLHAQVVQPIRIAVDATDAPRKIFHAQLTIPVSPGPLTLLYPKWIPGEHAPTGPIANLTALKLFVNGQRIPWRRDDVELFAIHCDIPQGAAALDVSLDFLSTMATEGFSDAADSTSKLAVVSWNQLLLYPQGHDIHDLIYQASLRLPSGWKYGTALPVAKQAGQEIDFAAVPLSMLVDSPVLAGVYYRALQLTPGQTPNHEIDMAAESEAELQMTPEWKQGFTRLVAETGALFGARHYRDYHFLLTLSDYTAHFGLEHHESSDNRIEERALMTIPICACTMPVCCRINLCTPGTESTAVRPALTPNYEAPMKTDLLWVYEGLTTYLGEVLTARSGLWNPEQFREDVANIAAKQDHIPGREWRPLEDTAIAAPFSLRCGARLAIAAARRRFLQQEGLLIWLEVDTIMRHETQDHRSLDDFCRAFYGPPRRRTRAKDLQL